MDEPDWMVYAGFVFDALASLAGVVAIFIAVRAYRVAKEQARTDFELEVLRGLLELTFDEGFREAMQSAVSETISRFGVRTKLRIFPLAELKAWRKLEVHFSKMPSGAELFKGHRVGDATKVVYEEEPDRPEIALAIDRVLTWEGLRGELIDAIERRMK
ncbi:hypothetical protein ABZS52_30690 [Micromonospora profundi]|uniref:hypothetical protein n=1 Tax=Micromonospora profundi TaxID=1420889 RepID=UPI0033BA38A5